MLLAPVARQVGRIASQPALTPRAGRSTAVIV